MYGLGSLPYIRADPAPLRSPMRPGSKNVTIAERRGLKSQSGVEPMYMAEHELRRYGPNPRPIFPH